MKKILSLTLIFIFLFNFSACKNTRNIQNTETTKTQDNTKPFLYTDLIDDYKAILEFRLSDDFEEKYNNGTFLPEISDYLKSTIKSGNTEHWSNMLVELPTAMESSNKETFSIDYYGYILYDLNGDGIDELFWVRKDYSIIAIFTIYNEKLTLLDAFWSRHRATINQQGLLITQSSGGALNTRNTISHIENGELVVYYMLERKSDRSQGRLNTSYTQYTKEQNMELSETAYYEILKTFTVKPSNFWLSQKIQYLK